MNVQMTGRRCAIMQPTFLPWAGYFHLMAAVDVFVFLDDVKVVRQSWQTRNRILNCGQSQLVVLPVLGSDSQAIAEVHIDERSGWRRKQILTLRQTYARAPFGKAVVDALAPLYGDESLTLLADFNCAVIERLARLLEIETPCVRSSVLAPEGVRSARLLNLCRTLDCVRYLSPRGSMQYLEEDDVLEPAGLEVSYSAFEPGPYTQLGLPFVSHLCIVDVVAFLGFEAAAVYVRTGQAP
ncbi:MAG: hypothetical protein EXR76_01295 [Myxococcales bacterium]|nr:hypothetical protein [Myxococcales bacterium]